MTPHARRCLERNIGNETHRRVALAADHHNGPATQRESGMLSWSGTIKETHIDAILTEPCLLESGGHTTPQGGRKRIAIRKGKGGK